MHLMVEISEARVEAGQPHSEIIVVDSMMAWPGFIYEPFVETARFSDWRTNGNHSSRYYHLMNRKRGLCLNSEPASGGRLIAGIYAKRTLILPDSRLFLIDWLSQDKEMSHLFDTISCHAGLHFCLIGGGSIVFKYNCVEFYDDTRIRILASLKVPLGIIIAFEGLNYFLRSVQHLEYSSDSSGFFHSIADPFGDVADVRMGMQLHLAERGLLEVSCELNAFGFGRHVAPVDVGSINFF